MGLCYSSCTIHDQGSAMFTRLHLLNLIALSALMDTLSPSQYNHASWTPDDAGDAVCMLGHAVQNAELFDVSNDEFCYIDVYSSESVDAVFGPGTLTDLFTSRFEYALMGHVTLERAKVELARTIEKARADTGITA